MPGTVSVMVNSSSIAPFQGSAPSGIRRGVDILVAIALGAKAVLVGRPVVCGLAVAGELGVSHVLRLLRDELEIAMLLCGCRNIDEITKDMVHLKL